MNIVELKTRLAAERFDPSAYCIGGTLPAYEGLILEKFGERWKIEHFERGERYELESFVDEEMACNRMYELLTTHFR